MKILSWFRRRRIKDACADMILEVFEGNLYQVNNLIGKWAEKFGWEIYKEAINKLVDLGIFRWQNNTYGTSLILTEHGCRVARYILNGDRSYLK